MTVTVALCQCRWRNGCPQPGTHEVLDGDGWWGRSHPLCEFHAAIVANEWTNQHTRRPQS